MALFLELRRGRAADGRSRWPLDGTDSVVGSGTDCDLRLEGAAPRHCQFGFRGGRWMVVDLGGGTALDGAVLDRPLPVAAGSRVSLGPCELEVVEAIAAPSAAGGPAAMLMAAAGLDRSAVAADDARVLATAGTMLRLLVDGVVSQLARRDRDKAELGADRTAFSPGAVNPLKALPADRALAALLDPDARGTMAGERAVADAMADLDAHAAATLTAMQGALAATLDRFSPAAIRGRATAGGLMARVLPAAKEAALWQAYEREFDGVRRGSSDAFVELFATAFAAAYREASSGPRPPS